MRILFILCLIAIAHSFGQNENLAKNYFDSGDFEKALLEYKKLYARSPSNPNYITQIVVMHQQLEQYDQAETFLKQIVDRIKYPTLFIELGYNYQLKNDTENANANYQKAIKSIEVNPSYVFSVTRSFQKHSLLDEAIIAYEKAMLLNSEYNFSLQLAQLYGEQGHIENMFTGYVNFAERNPASVNIIKRYINDFISENSTNENNIIFRKILLKKTQTEPNVLWNELLSWLFIQQNDFKKAFIQEKAIYNRAPESLNRIEDLAEIALDENDIETAKTIYNYIIETAQDSDTVLKAHYNLIQIQIIHDLKPDYDTINSTYMKLFEEYGAFSQTLNLQISYAHFFSIL